MSSSYRDFLYERYQHTPKCVSMPTAARWLEDMLNMLFPVSKEIIYPDRQAFDRQLEKLENDLTLMIACSTEHISVDVPNIVATFFSALPSIIKKLQADIDTLVEHDPAAASREEVIRCYPGPRALAAYRLAHYLHRQDVPVIPRLLTECAHSKTGIDIHPAAQIGSPLFIDHGTGIVIGATAVIGNRVKIYQGVTLGGLNVDKADKDVKRHPTIEDDVVIYAGATILGGDTVIGRGSIIGGNAFITRSVEAGTKVYHTPTHQEKHI